MILDVKLKFYIKNEIGCKQFQRIQRKEKKKMNYDGTLIMPNNCLKMSNEEMVYLEGGINLGMKRSYLNKQTCLYLAGTWVREKIGQMLLHIK